MNEKSKLIGNALLRKARKARGWSQQDVAERIDAPQAYLVSRWENGHASPSPYYRQKLSEIFGKSLQELGLLDNIDEIDTADVEQEIIIPPSLPRVDSSYQGMTSPLILTDSRTIEQRRESVENLYAHLTDSDITGMVLTGISGVGKSTFAALVYNYAEELRNAGYGPFISKALWLTIDDSTTFTDIIRKTLDMIGKSVADFSTLSPYHQAFLFFNLLNTVDEPRLIILDQFENFLDANTGQALEKRPGVGEWLDIVNSQHCCCRFLLTSRPRPNGTRQSPPTFLKEYSMNGLHRAEGISLLRKLGIEGTDAELAIAVQRCEGHAYALVLLASLLTDYMMNLSTLLKDTTLWTEDIAVKLIHYIYKYQLNPVQHTLLQAFSVYREGVPLEAAQPIVANVPKMQMLEAFKGLRTQYLLHALGNGRFRVHNIVAEYVRNHFDEHSVQMNANFRVVAHTNAAQYYLKQMTPTYLPRAERRTVSNVFPLIEATWQYCQAGRWQEAYDLLEQENLFFDLHLCGGDAILLELYQSLLFGDKMDHVYSQVERIYRHLGEVYHALGQLEKAQDYYKRALHVSTGERKQKDKCQILILLGITYDDQGDRIHAQDYYEQALTCSRKIGDLEEEGRASAYLGWVYNGLGKRLQALEQLKRALSIFQSIKNLDENAWTFTKLGNVYLDLGEKEQASSYFQQALELFRSIGNRSGEAWALGDLGAACNQMNLNEQALTYLEQALNLFRELNGLRGEAWTLCHLGTVYDGLHQKNKAQACLEQALSMFKEIGDAIGESTATNRLSMIYEGKNEVQKG